ncbi:Mannose-6-phosphate isomerase [Blattella germanica]|nr:Mannose-6-phosphate isomerase [Blattella germanica]
MELRCAVQQYAWGKYGQNSEVAALNSNGDPDFMIDDDMPYAELWMGTHPNGPSILKGSSQKLSEWIIAHPDSLGTKVRQKFGIQLPFLFKVLSINQALSIQAHPDKAVVGQEAVNELLTSDEAGMQQALKNCFYALMTCSKELIESQLSLLATRLASLDESSLADTTTNLFQCLYQTYPGDVGCFSVYFMNHVVLQPGEAIFLGPNEPHAYLSGDCVECMACSDNVVRAGLTPKYKDVETLCNMLTYICEPATSKLFQGILEDDCTVLFSPPVPDFAVAKINVPVGTEEYTVIPRDSASLLIVISGHATSDKNLSLERGSVIFLPANEKLELRCNLIDEPLLVFQAMSNVCTCNSE